MSSLKEQLKEQEQILKQAQDNIERMKKELESEQCVLRLRVKDGDLEMYIGNGFLVGYIDSCGRCYILTEEYYVEKYELWREYGCKINDTVVDWRGGSYQLYKYSVADEKIMLMRMDKVSEIYDLTNTVPSIGCQDSNIIRHKHNDCPVMF